MDRTSMDRGPSNNTHVFLYKHTQNAMLLNHASNNPFQIKFYVNKELSYSSLRIN